MGSDRRHSDRPRTPLVRHAHRAYLGGVWFKGIHGVVDLLIAVVVLAVPQLLPSALLWTLREAGDDLGASGALLSGAISRVDHDLLTWPGWLLGVFLLVHGAVKLASAVCLLRRITRGYPWAIAALVALLVYQVVDAVVTTSLTMAALAVIDVAVIALVVAEYRQLRIEDLRGAAGIRIAAPSHSSGPEEVRLDGRGASAPVLSD